MRTKLLLVAILFSLQIDAQQCWSKIESGIYHTIAIAQNGTLWSWGYNSSGQLGNGTSDNSLSPVQIGSDTDWLHVGAGYYHSFAIKSNGTLWAWGHNASGQLGDGTILNKLVPIQIGTATDWLKVSGGESHSVAIKTDGTLWTWGSDTQGQLGNGADGANNVPTQVGSASDWIDIDAGRYHVIALKNTNKIYTWGFNGNGQIGNGSTGTNQTVPYLVTTTGTANFIKVEAGVNSSLAIKSDNSLWITGLVGPTYTTFFQHFAYPMTWLNVKAGTSHVVAVKSDGTLWAWGNNGSGQIAQPGYNSVSTPYQISGSNYSSNIAANLNTTLALKNDGTLYGAGQNHVGQLGDNTSVDKQSITGISCPSILSNENFEIQNSISIYPNPVKNTLNISLQETAQIQKVVIYDVTGKQVKYQEGNTTSINVEDLKSGLYLFEVTINDKTEVKKFIKQ
jgi:alpha-tubulin suppressor-like RCC1 family protein